MNFFHASTGNPGFLLYMHIPVGHPQPFAFHRNFILHFFQINCMESLWIHDRGSQYTLVQHNLARWTPLFLFHFYHEPRQRHNACDRPKGSESSQFNVKIVQFFLKTPLLNIPLSRPTLVLEVVLSCRLVLAAKNSDSNPEPGIHPWSNDSDRKVRSSDEN